MSIKNQTLPVWTQMLDVLDGLLAKAAADERGDALLNEKLADDMHPLSVQVRFLVNMPGEAMERLAGVDFTSREDNPSTLVEAREWVAAAKSQLEEWATRDFVAPGDAIVLEHINHIGDNVRRISITVAGHKQANSLAAVGHFGASFAASP